jgi:glycosyltransferase involved in cell wall biosynthesis
MRIVFYPQSCVPHHAHSLEERPLGGIETAIIRLAEALHVRGHEVIVCTAHPQAPNSLPPYLPFSAAQNLPPHDVFVSVREWIPLLSTLPCQLKIFWTGDSFDQIQNFGLGDKRVQRLVDSFFAVSAWHAATLCEQSGFPVEKVEIVPYGVHVPFFQKNIERHPRRLLYSSTPFRGLELLPNIFRKLKNEFEDLELLVCSGFEVYRRSAQDKAIDLRESAFAPLFEQLRQLPGCEVVGGLRQEILAEKMLSSSILAYPNTFPETFCITALEAQAAGCVPVTSALGALPETVGDAGILIPGQPGSAEYGLAFFSALRDLLLSPDRWRELSERGRMRAGSRSWNDTAEIFEQAVARVAHKKGIQIR